MGITTRLTFLLVTFVFIGLLIIGRLFFWQVVSYQDLVAAAEKQHYISLEIPANRGQILAADGFPLASNQEAHLVFASLNDLDKSPTEIAAMLSPLIASPSAVLEKEALLKSRLSRENLAWVPLQHKVDRETKEIIEALGLNGIGFEAQEKRGYPEASAAAHLLGFVGSDINGKDKGYFGLEGFYDWQLRGRPGRVNQEKDALGRPILVGGFGQRKSEDGRDLKLFLDRAVQFSVEEKLAGGIKKFGAKAGSAVVMDPQTGGILAMASFPAYDPAVYTQFERTLYKNPVVADLFEPGSILKPLIMAAALNEGVVKPETGCDRCGGPRSIGGFTIRTFDDSYVPNLSMAGVIERSDNVGMVFVAEEVGEKKIFAYLEKFGLSEKTGVDLEEETAKDLRPLDQWRPIDLATVSFGQGVAITRLQIARAFCAFANGGKLVQPMVVEKIVTPQGEIEVKSEAARQIIKPQTARVITEMLVNAAEKSPLRFPRNRIPALKNYRIAAKSGTAEIPVGGEYDPEKTIASVIGYAPADDPKFVVLVSLVEPSVRPWGSDTAGPIFFEILNDLFLYYGIQPS